MKKILSLLATTGLVATTASTVIACQPDNNNVKDTLTLESGKTISNFLYESEIFYKDGKLVQNYSAQEAVDGEDLPMLGVKWYSNEAPGELISYRDENSTLLTYFTETKDLKIEIDENTDYMFAIKANKDEADFTIFLLTYKSVLDENAKTLTETYTTLRQANFSLSAGTTTTVMDLTIADGNKVSDLLDRADPSIEFADGKLSKTYGVTAATTDGQYEIPELPGSNRTRSNIILNTFNESEGWFTGLTTRVDGTTKRLYDNIILFSGTEGSTTFDVYLVRIVYNYDEMTADAIGKGVAVTLGKGTFTIPTTAE